MDSADHSQFQFAAERYVLGDLSEPETLVFEEHFFSCASCAQDVEDLTTIRVATPVVLPLLEAERPQKAKRGWFSLPWVPQWAPQFALGAMALLCVVTAYQNAVQIPRLKAAAGQEDLQLSTAPEPVRASRGAGTNTFSISQRAATVLIANEWPEKYDTYSARVGRQGEGEPMLAAQAAGGDRSLMVVLPASRLGAGTFELTIFGNREGKQPELVARYPFTIQEKK